MPQSTIEQAKADALKRLFGIPGVTGVGIGPKVTGGRRTGEVAIIVFTAAKKPLEQIPSGEQIPSEIDGHKTDVIQAGLPRRVNHVPLEPLEDTKQYPVLRGGLKISGGGANGSGTLGCVAESTNLYVSGSGRIVLITNHHVLFSEEPNDVTPHCNISVGQTEQSCCCPACDFWANIVGHIRANSVSSPTVDGATAELKPGIVWRPEIEDEDSSGNPVPIPIAGVVTPDLTQAAIQSGYAVWKRGSRTRKTTGNVIAVNVSSNNANQPTSFVIAPDPSCPYPTTNAQGFVANQAVFDYPGDSGSIVLNMSNQVVGLIWAVDPSTGNGYACAIGAVQDQLCVAIKTTANTPAGDQTVPATNDTPVTPEPKLPLDDRNTYAPSGPIFAGRRGGADPRLEALLRTPRGQAYVSLAFVHRDELLRLVNTNRRVATVWHRNGGPAILHSLMHLHDDLRLPGIIDGQPLEVCLQRIAGIFERYGSEQLRADIGVWRSEIIALAHCSFGEIVGSFSQDYARAG